MGGGGSKSEEVAKLAAGEFAVVQNRNQEARSDAFSRVDRDHSAATVCAPQKVVAAAHADNFEAGAAMIRLPVSAGSLVTYRP